MVLPVLSQSAHDRAALHRTDDEWLAQAWTRARVLRLSARASITPARWIDGQAELELDSSDGLDRRDSFFLGLADEIPHFAVIEEPFDPTGWASLRDIGASIGALDAGLLTEAVALAQWHLRHPRCPRCGAATVVTQAGWTRTCVDDGSEHFPRTDPAVIMLVHDGADRCILGRQALWPEGRFSVLAGFVEAGESAEAAVSREVAEEVGVAITDIRYVASQPWPFPASLMLGFTAQVEGAQDLLLADQELAEAGWFSRDEIAAAAEWGEETADGPSRLRALPGEVSIARQLINAWLAEG